MQIGIILLSVLPKPVKAQDYIEYHRQLNRADYLMFVRNEFDSGLNVYNQAFNKYDFVFVKDCVIAIQISLFRKRDQLSLRFIEKAFQNGLKLSHLRGFHYIANSEFYRKNGALVERLYIHNRPIYLKRVNFSLLNQVNRLFAADQAIKNGPQGDAKKFARFRVGYRVKIKESIEQLKKVSIEFGFPSDRLIGIDQNDIMKETKMSYKDLPDYFEYYGSRETSNRITLSQFQHEERFLSSHLILPLMHHLERAYYEFPISFYQNEIKKGNIHPKDVAAINDFPYATLPPDPIGKDSIYYGVGVRFQAANSLCIPDSLINRNRSFLGIQKIEYDRKKWQFMYEHKMDFIFGYVGCRS